jgi:tripartite-type tricarboxylate transporter receptor subunit TctC
MKPHTGRANCIVTFLLAASALLPQPQIARAATYPERTVTLVVPFAAGGGIDIVARIFASKLAERLRQPVIVENRVGGGGIVGTASVARAAPDGYTLLMIEASSVLEKWLHKDIAFKVETDFAPIAMVATTYLGLFANTSLPVSTMGELIAYSKANPGKLSVGTPGIGSPHQLAAMMLNRGASIDIASVAYRGSPPSVADLISNQIPLVWAVPLNVMPFVAQGKARLLAVSAPHRLAVLPNTPSVAEFVPGFDVTLWLGVAVPARTPPNVVDRLEQAIHEISDLADVQERLTTLGYKSDFRNGVDFRERILADQKKFGDVIHAAGIQPK